MLNSVALKLSTSVVMLRETKLQQNSVFYKCNCQWKLAV